MNPDIKARWVQALRSGKYAQGRGVLAQKAKDGRVKYCCLGVLCELAVLDGVAGRRVSGSDSKTYSYHPIPSGTSSRFSLPYKIAQWAGIETYVLPIPVDGVHSLIGLNDNIRADFNMIADVIEAQL